MRMCVCVECVQNAFTAYVTWYVRGVYVCVQNAYVCVWIHYVRVNDFISACAECVCVCVQNIYRMCLLRMSLGM